MNNQNTSGVPEKIIERIKKLLALAGNNPNENEAALAMERAHKLLAEYNLTSADINKPTEEESYGIGSFLNPSSGPWARTVCNSIAKLYFCEYYVVPLGGRRDKHNFIGKRVNVNIAKLVCEYVMASLIQQARAGELRHGTPWRNSFRNSAAMRIQIRCKRLIEEACKPDVAVGSSNALMLASLYEKEKLAIADYEKKQNLQLKQKTDRSRTNDVDGAIAGHIAGDKVALRPQVSTPTVKAITGKLG